MIMRWVPVAALVALFVTAPSVGADTVTPPDLYQVTAGSANLDQRGYQTGSPVDPLPAENTALGNTTLSADSTPSTQTHAAYVEPPATAQALTQLNNVPVSYPTQANAVCSGCPEPQTQDAQGSFNETFDDGGVSIGAATAEAQADLYDAAATTAIEALNLTPVSGQATFDSELTQLESALSSALSSGCLPLPTSANLALPTLSPLPGLSLPAIPTLPALPSLLVPTPSPSGCSSSAGGNAVLAATSSASSVTSINTDNNGTKASTTETSHNVGLFAGLITIGTVTTSVTAAGAGTSDTTSITASTNISNVCIANKCQFQITAQGICQVGAGVQACSNDPVNQELRSLGFNVCRLGQSTSGDGTTTVSGTASGILAEWHADQQNQPDPSYYSSNICSPDAPQPKSGFAGLSAYVVVGESSLQLQTSPNSNVFFNSTGSAGSFGGGYSGFGGGASSVSTPAAAAGPISLYGLKIDRRWLFLALFGTLEISLIYNVSMVARSRVMGLI